MEDVLRSLNLTNMEIKVFLVLNKIGISTAYEVAKDANLYKSNTYSAIKSLVGKGIVERRVFDGKVLYEAVDPNNLLSIVDKIKFGVEDIIPRLLAERKSSEEENNFHVYQDSSSLLSILRRWLEFKEPIYLYGVPKHASSKIGRSRMDAFHVERIKKKIEMYHIYNYDATERMVQLKNLEFTPIRVLPESFNSAVATNICHDEIIFIIWEPRIKIFLIKDKDLVNSYKKYFMLLWEQAKNI